MNRIIKEATVKRYHDHSHDDLKQHLPVFLIACNFAKRLETLKKLTLYEYICTIWTNDPGHVNVNSFQHNAGLNIEEGARKYPLTGPFEPGCQVFQASLLPSASPLTASIASLQPTN